MGMLFRPSGLHESLERLAANKGPGQWYADSDSLRYSFFDKIEDDE